MLVRLLSYTMGFGSRGESAHRVVAEIRRFGSTMEAERESNPTFQCPLTIALGLAGKGASVEAPAITFDAKSLVKTGSAFPGNSEDSKVHLTHGQEDQSEIRAEVETVVTDESNIASYAVKPGFYEKLPVGVAVGLAKTSIDGLAWYVKTTLVEEGEDIGCFKVMGQVGEDTSRSARIAYMVARQTLLEKQPDNIFFANSKLSVDLPTLIGASAGCTVTTSLLSLAMKKPIRKDLAMSGEITPTGGILQIGSVKEKTIGARRSQVKTIIFPEANRKEFEELPEKMKEGLDVHFVYEYEQIFKLAFGYDSKPVMYEDIHIRVAMCLAMTSISGISFFVKTSFDDVDEGDGCLHIMSSLGEEMIESVCIGYNLAAQIFLKKNPENTFFADSVVSIFLPACSTNNDTSAGSTIVTAFLSLAMDKPVRKDLAMTGTVTPNGKILGIGSVKEKTIGARRSQVKTIIFPESNRRDFDGLPENVKEGLHVHFVDEYEQIFELAFGYDH